MDWKRMLTVGYENMIFMYVLSVTLIALFQNMEAFINKTLY